MTDRPFSQSRAQTDSTSNESGSATDKPQPFDLISWNDVLQNVGGDNILLNEVVLAFLEETPKLLAAAEQAARQRDTEALCTAAHSIKGSLLFLNVDRAYQTVEKMEIMAADSKLAHAQSALDEFKGHFQSVCQSLQTYLDDQRNG